VPPAASPAISSSVFRVPFPATSGHRRGRNRWEMKQKFEIKSHSKTLLYQSISHTFCPECFVLCPACI
ncbi:unnamed protein product, partial [Staurois parvus]